MSMPHYTLECEQCGNIGTSLSLFGHRIYVEPAVDIPVRAQLGWCGDCNRIGPIECFDDAASVAEEIAAIRTREARIRRSIPKRLANALLPSRRQADAYYRHRKQALLARLELIERRQGDERCLSCGGRDLAAFQGDTRLPYDGLVYQGQRRTGFYHPRCGGEIIASGSEMRFSLVRTTSRYTPEGDFIEQIRD